MWMYIVSFFISKKLIYTLQYLRLNQLLQILEWKMMFHCYFNLGFFDY